MNRAAIKWFLNVLKALSAAFLRYMCGVTSSNYMYESSKYFLRSSDTSLSMMRSFGVNTFFLDLSWNFIIQFRMQGPIMFLSGVVKILLAS